MAYNPSLYNPYGQGYQMYQQPINGLVSVTGMEGAKAYQLPPNSAIALFDADSDVMYVKTTDSAGYPTIRAFTFQPMEPIDTKPAEDYVPRSEFDALQAQVKALAESRPTRTRKAAADGE